MKFSYSNWVAELEQQDELTPLEQRFNPWSKRFQWLNDHSEHILSFCAAICIAISSVISSPTLWTWGLLLVGALLLAASIITAIRRQELLTQIEKHYHSKIDEISEARSRKSERISVLEETMTKAEQYIESDRQAVLNVLHEATESMARELDLWDTEIRLSLYRHSAVRGEFIRLARVSDNPDLESVGRNAYPDDEGIIAQAWQHGHALPLICPRHAADGYSTKSASMGFHDQQRIISQCMQYGCSVSESSTTERN